MSLARWSMQLFFSLILLTVALGHEAIAQAQDAKVVLVVARWEMSENGAVLVIPFSDALTAKQKNMITGGFTTVSQLSVHLPGQNSGEQPGAIFNAQCSVKFDAWEETYDIVRVESENSVPFVSKDFTDYARACLTGDIKDQSINKRFDAQGGYLQAQLTVKQTSADEALKIKDWLIQQQSGVMQSLFSHMLGDIALHQTHVVNIRVPKRSETSDPATKQDAPATTPKKGRG
jgi:hypothetical protein